MSDDEARALGERAIEASIGFRPGMLLVGKDVRVVSRKASTNRLAVANDLFGLTDLRNDGDGWCSRMPGTRFDTWAATDFVPVPDLRDPATRGAALDVVRERYNDPTIYIEIGFTGPDTPPNAWLRSGAGHDAPYANESTEAEALVSALESKEPA